MSSKNKKNTNRTFEYDEPNNTRGNQQQQQQRKPLTISSRTIRN